MAYIYIERKDSKIAMVEIPDDAEDVWSAIEERLPLSYDIIDEKMIIPGEVSLWDDRFDLDDQDGDKRLCMWVMGGPFVVEDARKDGRGDIFQTFHEDIADAVSAAKQEWKLLTPREQSERRIVASTYKIGPDFFDLLDVVWDSEDLNIPRKHWAEVVGEGEFGIWGEGQDMNHPVQEGTLYGIPFEIVYEFKDGEAIPHEADDGFWLAHVVSVRWVRD